MTFSEKKITEAESLAKKAYYIKNKEHISARAARARNTPEAKAKYKEYYAKYYAEKRLSILEKKAKKERTEARKEYERLWNEKEKERVFPLRLKKKNGNINVIG